MFTNVCKLTLRNSYHSNKIDLIILIIIIRINYTYFRIVCMGIILVKGVTCNVDCTWLDINCYNSCHIECGYIIV